MVIGVMVPMLPASPGGATTAEGVPGEAGPALSKPAVFNIMEYQVDGNTLLPVIDVEEAVYPFLGFGKTPADIEAARAALENAYQKRGFATVTAEIPPQDAASEVVKLRVVERPVGRLRVRGSRYFSLDAIKQAAPSLAEGTVPNFDEVEEDIVDLNLIPDRRVTPVLKAGIAPGTVDVDLQVEDGFPLHGSFELNNRKSQNTEPLRAVASLRYDNLWQRGDSISMSYQVAPQRTADTEVFTGSYLARVPDSRLSLLLYGLKSDSDVAAVGGTSVVGQGEIIGGRALLPVTIQPGFVQSLSGGVDYKHFEEDVVLGSDTSSGPVTYYPFSFGWTGNWSAETSRTEAGATVVFTLTDLGSSSTQFNNKRDGADPSFILLQADASRTQDLPEDFQAFARLQGQAAGQPLISNEQFSLGGLDSVRGYLESEALGDYGMSLQSEIRSPSLGAMIAPWIGELRLRGFADFGAAGVQKPGPEQDGSFLLSSAGVGATIRVLDHVGGSLDVAVPLKDGPETQEGHVRTLFRAWGEF